MTFFRGKSAASHERDPKGYGSRSQKALKATEATRASRRSRNSDAMSVNERFHDEHSPITTDEADEIVDDSKIAGVGPLMEYSDTSEEQDPIRRRHKPSSSKNGLRKQLSTESMRVVRFNSSFSDDEEDVLRSADRIQPPNMHESIPPPPPPDIRTSSNINHRHHSNSSSSQPIDNSQSHSLVQQNQPKRKTHRKQHIHPSKSPDWMTQLAYSFRSPSPLTTNRKQLQASSSNLSSSNNIEYPPGITKDMFPSAFTDSMPPNGVKLDADTLDTIRTSNASVVSENQPERPSKKDSDLSFQASEASPLLGDSFLPSFASVRSTDTPSRRRLNATQNYVALAASFLRDYEGGRAPTLSTDLDDVTDRQLRLYEYKFGGYSFQASIILASIAIFASSMLEGFDVPQEYKLYLTALNLIGSSVFMVDIWFRSQLRGNPDQTQHTRTSRSERLVKPVILFAIILAVENIARVIVTPDNDIVLFSSLFKPLVLFYTSSKARDALEALRRIIRIVVRVLAMELLLILMFAAVACRLFREFNNFVDLSTAWLSLFELSTTVVNPSIWMPIYQNSPYAAIFFMSFIVISVFYLHSLVLSVVFSTYIQAASEIHERASGDREDSIQMAFVALQRKERRNVVDVDLLRETLRILRPHYNAMKINALVEIVDPTDQRTVDFGTFRTKIRQALNASIRTARSATVLSTLVELVAVVVAVFNFAYVIMVSSRFHASWFINVQETVGSVITVIAGFELLIRFNPLRIPDFTPLTRLNATFDGLALIACITSLVGIVFYAAGYDHAIEYILIGRALDMVRIMRFFQIFRDVVRRSSDVLPALAGPVILVVTTLHIFVYLGMALWGGAVEVGQHFGEITYLYDLNNFNSYAEGLVTMFQVLVVNDWHAIAEVFLFAERCASPFIVYPVFILGNMIGVSIMLNVMTAFFVETFVTKLDDGANNQAEGTTTVQKDRDFNILTEGKKSVRRVATKPDRSQTDENHVSIDGGADADSEASSEDLYEFDVYEREGFDKIMETVAGNAEAHEFAQHICNYLEIFEKLTPGREKVGYLICDQKTLERFGNRRFQSIAAGFLSEQELNETVSDMHAQLLVLSAKTTYSNDRAVTRTFPHSIDSVRAIEISASILRRHPAVSLFVIRLKDSSRPALESST